MAGRETVIENRERTLRAALNAPFRLGTRFLESRRPILRFAMYPIRRAFGVEALAKLYDAVTAPLKRWLRGGMDDQDLIAVIGALSENDIPFCIAGGWGVDALLGGPSRPHDDADVILVDYPNDRDRALDALGLLGYRLVLERIAGLWMPDLSLLDDGLGHRIEILSMNRDLVAQRMSLPDAPGGPVSSEDDLDEVIFSTGYVGKHEIVCLSLRAQLLFHTGFELRMNDIGDVGRLLTEASSRRIDPGVLFENLTT